VRLGTVMMELKVPLSPLTARHPERTANRSGKEIDTGTDRELI